VISAAENSNKFQRTRFWKGKSVEDVVTLGPMAQATLVQMKLTFWVWLFKRIPICKIKRSSSLFLYQPKSELMVNMVNHGYSQLFFPPLPPNPKACILVWVPVPCIVELSTQFQISV
jgi:hypothetical protein